MSHDGPRKVGESLDSVARRLGAPTASAMSSVFSRWADAVGEQIASHARPIGLVDGVLTVAVDEPVWATELGFRRDDLVARLSDVVGPDIVGRIELRVRPREGR